MKLPIAHRDIQPEALERVANPPSWIADRDTLSP
jgi:hypothetical protein